MSEMLKENTTLTSLDLYSRVEGNERKVKV